MSFINKENKVIEFLRNPVGLIITLGVIGCVILIVVSIVNLFKTGSHEPSVPTEVDPASGETIYLFPMTDGPSSESMYIGFELLAKNGMTEYQFKLFKDAVSNYAAENGILLERVSYLKDSYKLKASYVFDFKIVLNVDGEELAVEVDSSKGWKDILGAVARIWKDGVEVYRLEVNDTNVCDYRQGCYYVDDGT